MAFTESVERMGQTIRWVPEPKDVNDKSIYIGPVIQGFYIDVKTNVGQNASNIYNIQLPTGELVGIWGSGVLDGKFKDIPLGCEVRISYLGIAEPKKPSGRKYQNFKVEFDASSRAPMKVAGGSDVSGGQASLTATPATPVSPVAPQSTTVAQQSPVAGEGY